MAEINSDLLVPWALDAGTDNIPEYTGRDLRDLFAVFFEPKSDSEPFQAAPGILRGCQVSATSTEVTVQPGHCIVTTAGGSFLTGVKNPVTLPLSAPHETFNRIDLVTLSIEETAGTGRGASIRVIEGTPAAYPSNPVTPAGALVIASIGVDRTGYPRVTPGTEASLAGASKPPETITYSLGAGARYGSITGVELPGGYVAVSVNITMNGDEEIIGRDMRGFDEWYGALGDSKNVWWCALQGRGFLFVTGEVPPEGTVIRGSLLLHRQSQ